MNDLITTQRFDFLTNETFSKIYIRDNFECFGLEDEIRTVKVHGETAIPYGRYKLGLHKSPKFSNNFYYSETLNKLIKKSEYLKLKKKSDYVPHLLIHIQEVKNFEYILIHPLNTEDQTEGCLGVGKSIGKLGKKPAILNSIEAYIKLYSKVYKLIKQGIINNKQETIFYTN